MDKPSYYSILTADVRYDEELKPNEKLLFSEITALTENTGQCWASNKYFADLYGVDITTISRWIKHLKDRGYIDTDITYREGTREIEKRIITLGGIDEKIKGVLIKKSIGIDKKVKENNTSINNTSINKRKIYKKKDSYGFYGNVKLTQDEYNTLIKEFPNTYLDWIERCDSYVQQSGKKYYDFVATIRNWSKSEKKKKEERKLAF